MISGTCLTEATRWRTVEISAMRSIMQKAPEGSINLALGELGYPLPQSIREQALSILGDATPVYTPNAGLPELRESIAAFYSEDVSASRVCVCNGAQEALFLSLFSFVEAGDTIAVPDPDYTAYASLVSILGAKILRLPLTKDLRTVDWEQWRRLLSSDVKALVLSSPNNPCGWFLNERDAVQLCRICDSFGIALIVDEIYKGLVFAGSPASLLNRVEKLFIVSGLSKSHCMSGWRLGWVLGPPELADTLTKAKQYVSTCANWLAQKLAVYALSKQGRAAADKVFIQLLDSRGAVLSYLSSRCHPDDLHIPDASPYLLLRCGPDDYGVAVRLAAKGVITAPGSAFGLMSRGMIRINYGVDKDILLKGMRIVIDELYPH